MGLKSGSFLLALALFSISSLKAAPKLRISTAEVGPVVLAGSSSGPQQVIEAWNTSDGTLSLTAVSNAAWLVPQVAVVTGCTSRPCLCIPVRLSLNTAALPKGTHTGTVALNGPAAIDAPQTITVTVQMGGGVPDRVDHVAPPRGSAETPFSTTGPLTFSNIQGGNMPPAPGINSRPTRRGEALIMCVIGLGQISPAVESGQPGPCDPLAWVTADWHVNFGGSPVTGSGQYVKPLFIGLTPDYSGLYQVNVIIPEHAQSGSNVLAFLERSGQRTPFIHVAIE